jgi:flagellar protein FliO/FliZ
VGKNIKTSLSVFFLTAFAVFFLPVPYFDAQETSAPAQVESADASETDSAPRNPEESIILNLEDPPVAAPQISGASSSVFLFVRMILVLALVVGCIYAVMRFFRRGMTNAFTDDPYLKKTSSLTLAPGKTVHVVTLDDSAFLIGVTDNAVNLIGKIENKELVDAMNLYAEEGAVQNSRRAAHDFSRLLGIFTGKRQKKSFAQTLDETADIIRGQRSRIRGANGDEQ